MRWLISLSCLLALPVLADTQVRLQTNLGDIVIELNEEKAPISSANFLQYVDSGFYDGTLFHRVMPNFMIQGGGFSTDSRRKSTGDPITNEADNGLSNKRGTVAMARTNDPHSATAQFFINNVNNPTLDHSGKTARGWGYAVFGRVVEGMDVVDAISATPTSQASLGGYPAQNVPRMPIIIEQARRVVEDNPAESGQKPDQKLKPAKESGA